MNHSFVGSIIDSTKCLKCKKTEIQHTSQAECESCPTIGPVEMYYDMALCQNCIENDKKAQLQTELHAEQRVTEQRNEMEYRISIIREVDKSLNVRSDLFNAATASIIEIKELIDNDPEVTNKPYKLAEILTERFKHFKQIIFDSNQQIMDASNNQRAIQVYLNDLANKLRAEEREVLKIQDINYQPKPVVSSKPKAIKTKSTTKLDKAELKKYAAELKVPEYMLQTIVTSRNITLEQAANELRRSLNEAKSEN